MIATTSIQNYREHRDSGKLGTQAKALLNFIQSMPAGKDISRLELAEAVEMRLSSVCGRINELIAAGLIAPSENRKCGVSGKTICPVKAINNQLEAA
jgi:hypothetical protein